MLIDTHTHRDDARYNDDRDAMIARAREAGVEQFVTIGCDLATSESAVALADRYPFVHASIGVHPHEVKHIQDGWYQEFRRLAKSKKVVAYGEIGLDYHYNHSSPKEQRERFREQIQLARELRLPVIIHTREAQDGTIAILKDERASEIGGVFHYFSGDARLAKDALDLGFYLSFSGILTFQNASSPARDRQDGSAGSRPDRNRLPLPHAGPAPGKTQRAGICHPCGSATGGHSLRRSPACRPRKSPWPRHATPSGSSKSLELPIALAQGLRKFPGVPLFIAPDEEFHPLRDLIPSPSPLLMSRDSPPACS